MPADELLLREVVAEHRRLAERRRLVRAARSRPAYDRPLPAPRPPRPDVWDTVLHAFVRASTAS